MSPRSAREIELVGDPAFQVTTASTSDAHRLAAAIARRGFGEIEEVVVGERAVTAILRRVPDDLEEVAREVAALPLGRASARIGRAHEIPVTFDGEDVDETASVTGLSVTQLAEAMAGARLEVAMVGFVPGFGYLTGLPEPLAGLARRASPRASVPAGSLGVAGGYAGIYPMSTPGGWQLLGHTDVALFDPWKSPFALLAPGDTVVLRPVESLDHPRAGPPADSARPSGSAVAEVLEPGTLSMVQDLGRPSVARFGVPRAGAADPQSAVLANLAVGNDANQAVIEIVGRGPTLRLGESRCVALVGGGDLVLDGRAVARDVVHRVGALQTVGAAGPWTGARAYLAVGGGFATPVQFASRSSDLLCGLGSGSIRAGDELALGRPGRARARFDEPARSAASPVRVLGRAFVDRAPAAELEAIAGQTFCVDARSDRTGVRLSPMVDPGHGPASGARSVAAVTGAVQLPPDACPIVLGVDHATLGGYPAPGVVVSADLARIGQLRPGDEITFEVVDLAEARRAYRRLEQDLASKVRGWFPVIAG